MLGQGEEEVIGKILGFPLSLNHGKAFQISANHVSVDFGGTGTLMQRRSSSYLLSLSAPFSNGFFHIRGQGADHNSELCPKRRRVPLCPAPVGEIPRRT